MKKTMTSLSHFAENLKSANDYVGLQVGSCGLTCREVG